MLTVATSIDCDQLSIAPDGSSCYGVVQNFTKINGGINVNTEELAKLTKASVDTGEYAKEISADNNNILIVPELPPTAEPSGAPSKSPSAFPSSSPSDSPTTSPSS